MALTTTTLSRAVGVSDNTIVVASATGFAAGNLVLIDQEVMLVIQTYTSGTTIGVSRGQNGSVTEAHAASANVTTLLASDLTSQGAQTVVQWPVAGKARTVSSVSATATVAGYPGGDAVYILNGTTAIPLTITAPTKDMDGSMLIVVGNGKAAHTVTVSGGIGAGGTTIDVGTFATGAQISMPFIACNGVWTPLEGIIGGTAAVTALVTVTWA